MDTWRRRTAQRDHIHGKVRSGAARARRRQTAQREMILSHHARGTRRRQTTQHSLLAVPRARAFPLSLFISSKQLLLFHARRAPATAHDTRLLQHRSRRRRAAGGAAAASRCRDLVVQQWRLLPSWSRRRWQ